MTAELSFHVKYQAQRVLDTMTGELDARYDPILERYVYDRGGHERHMWLKQDETRWVIYIEEVPNGNS